MVTVTINLVNFLKYGHCTHFLVGHCHQDGKIISMVTVTFSFFGGRDHFILTEGTVTIYFSFVFFTFSSDWVQWPLNLWSLYPLKWWYKNKENNLKSGCSDHDFSLLVGYCTQLLVTVPKKFGHCHQLFSMVTVPILRIFWSLTPKILFFWMSDKWVYGYSDHNFQQ